MDEAGDCGESGKTIGGDFGQPARRESKSRATSTSMTGPVQWCQVVVNFSKQMELIGFNELLTKHSGNSLGTTSAGNLGELKTVCR